MSTAFPVRASSPSSGRFKAEKRAFSRASWPAAGVSARQGSVREGTSIGDPSPEARGHAMSVEPNVASIDYMGDRLTFFDCPGSIEFIHDMRYALPVCDAVVVVCEADPRKVPALQVILRELEEIGTPRILFLNKIDQSTGGLRETLEMLQPASRTPLLLRQIPVWENGVATGFVDLALERAFVYRESAPSIVIEMPAGVIPEEKQARYSMLEKLADYDDALMEQLISDIDPPRDLVFDDLARELREGHVVPVLMGSATEGHGVTRLLKAVRHEAPAIAHTRKRLKIEDKGPALGQVIRTIHTAHGGKLSLARVLRGAFADGATVVSARGVEERIGGLARLIGRDLIESRARGGGRHHRLRPPRAPRDRRSLRRRQSRPGRGGNPGRRLRPRKPSPFTSRTARTRCGWRALSPSFARRIGPCLSSRTPKCPR